MIEFEKFEKIARLSRDIVITEKIDGTNAQIYIISTEEYYSDEQNCCDNGFVDKFNLTLDEDYMLYAGSRSRWLDISSKGDNYGFAKWVQANAKELLKLGEGRHYGEWYGQGIQRKYGLDEKRFALFNTGRWVNADDDIKEGDKRENCPLCCTTVPVLYRGLFRTDDIEHMLEELKENGSYVSPKFMNPEGIVIYHTASGKLFKKTILNDEKPKAQVQKEQKNEI